MPLKINCVSFGQNHDCNHPQALQTISLLDRIIGITPHCILVYPNRDPRLNGYCSLQCNHKDPRKETS